MKYITVITVVILLFTEVVMPFPSDASIGNFVRRTGQEISEFFARKGGKEVLEEGSKVGAEEMGKFFARYGRHGRQAFKLVGDDVINFASRYGRDGVKMLAAHSAGEARFLIRHADEAVVIWRQFGRQGTQLLVRHPGLAKPLLEACGSRGIAVAKKLSEKNLVRLAYFSKKISRKNLDTIITWCLAKGDQVMEFLWRHKGKIIVGATVHTLLKDHEKGFTTTTLSPDGKPLMEHKTHNYLQHGIDRLTSHILGAYPWLPPLVGCSLLLILILMFAGAGKFFASLGRLFISFGKVAGKFVSGLSRFFSYLKKKPKNVDGSAIY